MNFKNVNIYEILSNYLGVIRKLRHVKKQVFRSPFNPQEISQILNPPKA